MAFSLSSQCSARGRACSAASDALRQQSSPQPCCSACAVSRAPQQCHCLCPVTETTRRQPAVAGAGERSPRASGESSASTRRRRRALFSASAGGPRTASSGVAAPPSAKQTGTPPCLRRREESSAPDAVAVAGGTPTRATGLSLRSLADTASRAHGLGAWTHSSPTPRRRVVAHKAQKGKGPTRGGFR